MFETLTTPPIADLVTPTFAEASTFLDRLIPGAMLAVGIAMMLVILLRRSHRYRQKLKRQARKDAKPSAQRTRRQEQRTDMFDRASPLLDAPSTVSESIFGVTNQPSRVKSLTIKRGTGPP